MSTRIVRGFCLLSVILFLSFLISATPARATGLGIAPPKLDVGVRLPSSATAILYVINTGRSEAAYKVYVNDEDYKGWFTVEPEEFNLPPGANRAVEITISPPLLAFGQHETYVCSTSHPPSSGYVIGAGIKVPICIQVSNLLLLIGAGVAVVLIGTLMYIVWWRRRREAL